MYGVDVLDGAMIVLAMFTLNLFHPGYLLVPKRIGVGIVDSDGAGVGAGAGDDASSGGTVVGRDEGVGVEPKTNDEGESVGAGVV